MKKQNSKEFIIEIFYPYLSCPYGSKLKIHVGNWAEALSVISTLCCCPSAISICTESLTR